MGVSIHPEVVVDHELDPLAVEVGIPLEGPGADGQHVWVDRPVPVLALPDVLRHYRDVLEVVHGPGVGLGHVDYDCVVSVGLSRFYAAH